MAGLDRKASSVGCIFADFNRSNRFDLYVTTDSWLSGANYTEPQLRQQGHTVEAEVLYDRMVAEGLVMPTSTARR